MTYSPQRYTNAEARSCLGATAAIRRSCLPAPAKERLIEAWHAAPFDECEATQRINAEREYLRALRII